MSSPNAHPSPREQPHAHARAALAAARAALAVGLAASALSCSSQAPPTKYPITLRVVTGQRPMPGAQIVIHNRVQGATDQTGSFRMKMPGQEGSTVEVTVRCPNGFTSPATPLPVVLRSTIALDRGQRERGSGIETTVECPPSHRVAAVIIRTPGRGNIPIVYDNQVITRTDPQGVAHMIFRVAPSQQLQFRLDTSGYPQLRPANPTVTVNTRANDEVYVATQNFEELVERRTVRRSGPVRTGPQRITPTRRNFPF